MNPESQRLPFSGRSPRTRHASRSGAHFAEPRAGSQAGRLLALYRTGEFTDLEASERLHLPHTTICARRNLLVDLDLIEPVSYETKQWTTGETRRTVWTVKKEQR